MELKIKHIFTRISYRPICVCMYVSVDITAIYDYSTAHTKMETTNKMLNTEK